MIAEPPSSTGLSSIARNLFYRRPVLWAILFAVLYLASRIYAVTHIPIFIDEAIHLDWSRPTLDSIPAPPGYEGKWLTIKLFSLVTAVKWPFDDLIAARLLIVVFGLTAGLACYLLARDLFSTRTALLTAGLYLVLPFTLIYSSVALTDGLQFALTAWTILLSVRLARSAHWSYTVLLPLAIAATVLSKFSALTLAPLPVIAVFVLAPKARWIAGALRALPTLLVSVGLFLFMRHMGLLQIFEQKLSSNGATPDRVARNLLLAGEWYWGLLTPTVAIIAVISALWLLWERGRAALFVIAVFAVTGAPFIILSENWYPRYLLTSVIPIMLAVSQFVNVAIERMQTTWPNQSLLKSAVVLLAIFGWPGIRSGAVIFDLPRAGIPAFERHQFVTGWPSGYGVRELAQFLLIEGNNTPGGIAVARLQWWDHPLQGLNLYLAESPAIELYTFSSDDPRSQAALARLSTQHRTLFVLSTERGAPQRLPQQLALMLKCGKEIWTYTRPGNLTGLAVYELNCGEFSTGEAVNNR